MGPQKSEYSEDFFKQLPKIELHRHLEGSLRLDTLIEIAKSHPVGIPAAGLASLVQVNPGELRTPPNFLSKFTNLRNFYQSPEIIKQIAYEAVADAAYDRIAYMELRFTPAALSRIKGYPMREVIDWVIAGAREGEKKHDIRVQLIASFNRNERVELAEDVIALAADFKDRGIVGVDLAGNEAAFSALPFAGVLREARQAGLKITVHAGEWGGPENVIEAIQVLSADRIGHGVRVTEDPDATAVAHEHQVPFEVCITSNYHSGVVPEINEHPLPHMLGAGLNVTLNTDDPAVSRIKLSDEYYRAYRHLNLSLHQLFDMTSSSVEGAFVSQHTKEVLSKHIRTGFQPHL